MLTLQPFVYTEEILLNRLQKTLKFLYQSTLIPTYLYNQRHHTFSHPAQSELTYPPLEYLSQLLLSHEEVAYLSTSFFAYYGAIKVSSLPGHVILVGPVSQTPYLKDTLRIAKKAFVVSGQDEANFESFLKQITPMPAMTISKSSCDHSLFCERPRDELLGLTSNEFDEGN